jgi:hypothetical protein
VDVRPLRSDGDERARRIAACVDRRLLPKLAPLVERFANVRGLMPAFADDEPRWYDPLVELVTPPPPPLPKPPLRPSTRKVLAFEFRARFIAGGGCLATLFWACLGAFEAVEDRRPWPALGGAMLACALSVLFGLVGAALLLHELRRTVARSVVVPALFTPAPGPAGVGPWRAFHVAYAYGGETYEVTRRYRRTHADLIGPSPDLLVDTKYPGVFLFKDLCV